jgi:hypothetical protein
MITPTPGGTRPVPVRSAGRSGYSCRLYLEKINSETRADAARHCQKSRAKKKSHAM